MCVCVCLAGWLSVCIYVSVFLCINIYLCMYEDALFTVLKIFALWERHVPRLTQFEYNQSDTVELLWLSSFGRDSHAAGDTTGRANSNLRALRLLRVGRLFRVVRIIRVVKFFRSLRTLVHSLVGTLRSLFWALLLLFLVTHVLAQLSVPRGRSQDMQGTIGDMFRLVVRAYVIAGIRVIQCNPEFRVYWHRKLLWQYESETSPTSC